MGATGTPGRVQGTAPLGVGPRPMVLREDYQPSGTSLSRVYSPDPGPDGPHKPNLVSFTSKFATILGLICIVIDYFISIIFHGVIQHVWCFFLEVPRIEELQDPDSSPRREEVGRRTLRDYGGFLLPFFYRDRFQLVHYSKTSG